MAVQVTGARELRRALRSLPKEYRKELAKIHKAAVEPVSKEAERRAPRRSGRLAGSIRPLGSQREGKVAVGKKTVPYAGVIHYGWPARNIRSQPFLTDALEKKQQEVVDIFVERQDRLIDRVWRASGL